MFFFKIILFKKDRVSGRRPGQILDDPGFFKNPGRPTRTATLKTYQPAGFSGHGLEISFCFRPIAERTSPRGHSSQYQEDILPYVEGYLFDIGNDEESSPFISHRG